MAEAPQKDAGKRPLPGSPEARESGRRNLNSQIAQRQKMLLAGIGAIALIGGGMFIFGGDGDEAGTDANGAATIDTGGLVNRNLSQREFVASYGNRLDAQGRAIKDLQQAQLPRPEIEQELEALRSENAQMRSDGQAAIDAISAENANLRSQLERSCEGTCRAAATATATGLWTRRRHRRSCPATARSAGNARRTAQPDELQRGDGQGRQAARGRDCASLVARSEPRLPSAQQLRTGNGHRGCRCLDRRCQPERSASRGAPDHRSGPLGDARQQTAHHRYHRLPRQRRGARRSLGREGLRQAGAHDLRAARRALRGERGQGVHLLRRKVGRARPRGQPRRQPCQPGAARRDCRRLRPRIFRQRQRHLLPVRSAPTVSARRCRRPTSSPVASARVPAKPPTPSADTSSNAPNNTNPSSRCRPASRSRSSFSTASTSGAPPNELQ